MAEDLESTKEIWLDYFEEEDEVVFLPYEEKLLALQVIVGFGRGFWAGVHGYSYIVYHTSTDKFYWFLRDVESDDAVYFYEISSNDELFHLLNNYSTHAHFELYDEALDYEVLYALGKGEQEELTKEQKARYKEVSLHELFGEDTEKLRLALMEFRPGSWGSHYPHKEFDKKAFSPIEKERLQKQAENYNNGNFHVFEKNKTLYISLGDDTFKLTKVNE